MCSKQRVRSILLSSLALLLPPLAGVGIAQDSQPCSHVALFDPHDFDHPTRIDNRFLPLVPGTQLTLDGTTTSDEGDILAHRVVFTVTDVTKVIDGVRTVVVWDRDFSEGQLEEEELAFFAQDNAGNVWNLGEYPEVHENGQFVGAPDTWISGVDRAEGGIHMRGDPQLGKPRYLQGWSPHIDFLDCAKVILKGQHICVPIRCYDNVLVTAETSPLEGGGRQLKYHAPGVGIIKVTAEDDPEGETLSLTKRVHLGDRALAHAREEVLRLDTRAYRFACDVYGDTEPAQPPP